jgi:hypothetical protein
MLTILSRQPPAVFPLLDVAVELLPIGGLCCCVELKAGGSPLKGCCCVGLKAKGVETAATVLTAVAN